MSLFIKLTTQALTDAKLMAAGPEAYWVWSRGLLYSKEHLTDGFVPTSIVPLLTLGCEHPAAAVQRLLDCGLWKGAEGGFTVGEERWARHQTTAEQVEESREKGRERQAALRARRREQQPAPEDDSSEEPQPSEAGEPLDLRLPFTGSSEGTDTPSGSQTPGCGVTHVSRDRNAVTPRAEHRAQSTEPEVKNYTHPVDAQGGAGDSGTADHTPPPAAPGTLAALRGVARQVVCAYPTSVAVGMDALDVVPPDLIAAVEGAILREAERASCDPQISAEMLLEQTRTFAKTVAEWPPGDEQFVPSLKNFFGRYLYRKSEKEWRRGTDRSSTGKHHGGGAKGDRQRDIDERTAASIARRTGLRVGGDAAATHRVVEARAAA